MSFLFTITIVILTVLSGILITLTRNGVFAVLYLVLAFILSVILLFIYEVYFLGIVFIIIYVGAIAVLFLFVIMMLNVKQIEYKAYFSNFFPLHLFVMLLFIYEFFNMFMLYGDGRFFFSFRSESLSLYKNVYFTFVLDDVYSWHKIDSDLYNLSYLLYNYYSLYLILCSIILLLSMIGAIGLTLNMLIVVKKQDLFQQMQKNIQVIQYKKKN